ncbi:MAG: alpha/beta hydrolase [Anaerolineae bacterium]
MTQRSRPDPSAFFLGGGPVGVLLIHGFTGSPPEMRLVGDYLHQRGFTVSGLLLPGHGTTVEDMNRRRWTDWTGHVEQALADLQARCETVFVGGLSMGSVLTLYLAARHPELPGAVLYSPAVMVGNRLLYLTPVLKHLIHKKPKSNKSDLTDPRAELRLWHYEEYPVFAAHELLKLNLQVRRLLPQVTCPLLVIHSTLDRDIHPKSARLTYERAGSADKELITLHNSGHCLTVDSEWEFVAEKTYEFIQTHLEA